MSAPTVPDVVALEIAPPQPSGWDWFLSWRLEPAPLLVLLLLAAAYAYGVLVLRRRGDAWPPNRSVSFGIGLLAIAVATMSSLGVFDTTLFSVHAVQHMILQMLAPVPLALSAPVTLMLRTFRPRPRKHLLAVLHSPPAKVLGNPLVGLAGFLVSPMALYNSDWYGYTLDNPTVHLLSHVHFLTLGCVFFFPLLGLDPVPGRLPYPARILMVFLVLPLHVLLGISIMSSTQVYGAEHYQHLARSWGASALNDQQTGGAIMWAFGDIVGIVFLGALLLQWAKADAREAERTDRHLDRLERIAAQRTSGGPSTRTGPM